MTFQTGYVQCIPRTFFKSIVGSIFLIAMLQHGESMLYSAGL